jgi:pimeloyl-ACP methyl ester carboxylesterase
MSKLKVAGAELDYDVQGQGPLVVFIAGAQGSGQIYLPLAGLLKDRFRVLTYDRRGFSNSALLGEQDYSRRLETDADDVAALIGHVGGGPAIVFGSSSGAIVALQTLLSHPEVVRTLVAHEPPIMQLSPVGEEALAHNNAIYDKYKAEGIPAAMQEFGARWLAPSDLQFLGARAASAADPTVFVKNMTYWFEHELRYYPPVRFDMARLKQLADRIVLVRGEEMGAHPTTPIIEALAEKLGLGVTELPGAHVGYAVRPEAFAADFAALLDQRARAAAR